MTEAYYGLVFRKIREQKNLSLSYFEKIGIRKSCISKFERGTSMIGFERIYKMLEAMDVSLEEYELLLNQFSPTFIEEFFIELEHAELYQDSRKLQKLYEEASELSNFFLVLIVKSKITRLTKIDTQRILEYLQGTRYWGYFELSLLQAALDTLSQDDIEKIFSIFEDRIDNYRGIFKYTRKIYQIAYQVIMILTVRGTKEFAEKVFKKTVITGYTDFDFFILSFRNLVIGFMKYRFESVEQGLKEITEALSIIKTLGGDKLYTYYQNKIDFYINQIDVEQSKKTY